MSDTTTARWRFALGQQVRWAGSPAQPATIVGRRWVERQVLAPYAEYHVQRPGSRHAWGWIVEADLDALEGEAR